MKFEFHAKSRLNSYWKIYGFDTGIWGRPVVYWLVISAPTRTDYREEMPCSRKLWSYKQDIGGLEEMNAVCSKPLYKNLDREVDLVWYKNVYILLRLKAMSKSHQTPFATFE